MTRHELVVEKDFGHVAWDTDGEYVIVHAEANPFTATALAFDGAQFYWMALPEI